MKTSLYNTVPVPVGSVISRVRRLMPQRSLTFAEAQRLAELQAAPCCGCWASAGAG